MFNLKNIFSWGRGNKSSVTFLACLFLATGIWVLNSLNNSHSTIVRIPVNIDPAGRKTAGAALPDFLEMEVKARGFTLISFLSRTRKYKINVLEKSNLSNDTVLSSMDAVWPLLNEFGKEIEITRISPQQFFLSGNKAFSKKLAVKGNYKLICKPSFLAAGPSVFYPDSVYIFSSSPIPETLSAIYAKPVVFENVDQPVFKRLAFQIPEGDYHLSSKETWLYIPIEPGTEINLEVPLISKNKYASEIFIPSLIKVTCLVPLSKFTATKADLFSFETKATAINTDRVIVRLTHAPYWAGKIRWEPNTVNRFLKQ